MPPTPMPRRARTPLLPVNIAPAALLVTLSADEGLPLVPCPSIFVRNTPRMDVSYAPTQWVGAALLASQVSQNSEAPETSTLGIGGHRR